MFVCVDFCAIWLFFVTVSFGVLFCGYYPLGKPFLVLDDPTNRVDDLHYTKMRTIFGPVQLHTIYTQ